jgi:hypothetical protein
MKNWRLRSRRAVVVSHETSIIATSIQQCADAAGRSSCKLIGNARTEGGSDRRPVSMMTGLSGDSL